MTIAQIKEMTTLIVVITGVLTFVYLITLRADNHKYIRRLHNILFPIILCCFCLSIFQVFNYHSTKTTIKKNSIQIAKNLNVNTNRQFKVVGKSKSLYVLQYKYDATTKSQTLGTVTNNKKSIKPKTLAGKQYIKLTKEAYRLTNNQKMSNISYNFDENKNLDMTFTSLNKVYELHFDNNTIQQIILKN